MTSENPPDDGAGASLGHQGQLQTLTLNIMKSLEGLGRGAYKERLGTSAELQDRLLGVTGESHIGYRVDIASDGLSLDLKALLEKELSSALTLSADPSKITIYFKRKEGGSKRPPPAPLKEVSAPFGLLFDKRAIPGVGEVIVVASGKGGVGKSTVSANLAVALAMGGAKVGLLDADIYGPSVPMMLGLKGPLEVIGPDRIAPLVAYGVKCVSFGFLTDTREPVIWRGPMIAKAVKQLCYNVEWGEIDYLIIDLPPGTGDVQLALIESLPIHGALVVTTPQNVALLDAHKAVSMFERLEVPIIGIVENMATYHCPQCGHVEAIFGQGGAERMGAERRINVVGQIPLLPAVRTAGDEGAPVVLNTSSTAAAAFISLAALVRGRGQRV